MAAAGAPLGEEAQNTALVQLERLRGGQIAGGQNDWLPNVDAPFGHAHQVVAHTAGHVPDVGGTGLHVGVVHLRQHGGELLPGQLHRPLGGAGLFHQGGVHAVAKVLVLDKHGVGLEQQGGVRSGFLPGLLGQGVELLDRSRLGVLQAALFRLHAQRSVIGYRCRRPLVKADGALDDAFGDALSLHEPHVILPPNLWGRPPWDGRPWLTGFPEKSAPKRRRSRLPFRPQWRR
jgi:hypothetical protein